jgi:hypothetical protein
VRIPPKPVRVFAVDLVPANVARVYLEGFESLVAQKVANQSCAAADVGGVEVARPVFDT